MKKEERHPFDVSGWVVDRRTHAGASSLTVEAWGRAAGCLGSSMPPGPRTAATSPWRSPRRCSPSTLARGLPRCSSASGAVSSSWPTPRGQSRGGCASWGARCGIPVDPTQPQHSAATPASWRVRGRFTQEGGGAFAKGRMAVFDRNLGKADTLFGKAQILFGSLDFCACGHCRSAYGPAAYLMELLQFLDRHRVKAPVMRPRLRYSLFTQQPQALPFIRRSTRNVLFDRRPRPAVLSHPGAPGTARRGRGARMAIDEEVSNLEGQPQGFPLPGERTHPPAHRRGLLVQDVCPSMSRNLFTEPVEYRIWVEEGRPVLAGRIPLTRLPGSVG
jgi:hypothetical protein